MSYLVLNHSVFSHWIRLFLYFEKKKTENRAGHSSRVYGSRAKTALALESVFNTNNPIFVWYISTFPDNGISPIINGPKTSTWSPVILSL
jgi:hypothetical protein